MDAKELYDEISQLKTEMTPRERMKNYVQGKEVDCLPFKMMAPDGALANVWGYTKRMVNESFDVRCEIIRRKRAEFGIEGIHIGTGLHGIGQAVGSVACYPENATEYIVDYFVKDYSVLEHLDEIDVYKNLFLSKELLNMERLKKVFPDMGVSTDVAGPLTTAIAMRPIEYLLRDMRKQPDKVHKLIQYGVDCSLKWVEAFYNETGSQGVSISDPVTTTDIIGRKDFLEFSKPYIGQLMDGIEKITGAKPSVHICGHSKKIWKDLVELGMDSYSLDNCESLAEAKEMIGDKVFLSGNVSPVEVMRNGTIDDVIMATKKCIAEGSDNPMGFMVMTGCQVPIGTPRVNMDAFEYAVRKYGKNAKIGRKIEVEF